jgi:cell fate regulator YaaT (PSP1 superfamily)
LRFDSALKKDIMIKIAGVRFRENWKVYDFNAEGTDVVVGDSVIVDTDRGPGFARVVRIKRTEMLLAPEPQPEPVLAPGELEVEVDEEEETANGVLPPAKDQGPKVLRKILRKATDGDITQEDRNRVREEEAFMTAQNMVTERDLPMKLIRVEYSFDASRATFFFFSESRVDFRDLVKDLAHKLKSRIEMRQIGVRDVARMIGGFGPCGRELCCSAFLKNFEPVSIRMAKKQEMVLNPAKISGVCGRLLCCLSYEYGMYDENKKDLAAMRATAAKDKQEGEQHRIADDQRDGEEQRIAEEKRRPERRPQEQQRDRPRNGARPDTRKGPQQEKKSQPQPDQQRDRQQRPDRQQARPEQQRDRQQPRQQPQPDTQQPQEQKPAQPQQPQAQQAGENAGKKKRRRFWRKKKKGQQGDTSGPPKAE